MPKIKTRKIDLNNDKDRKTFAKFLKSSASKKARKNNFFEKDLVYRYKKNNLKFKNDILRRKQNEGKKGYRYEVISKKTIGSGGFGKVHLIQGTYSPKEKTFKKPGHLTKKGLPKKARLVKIESVVKAEDWNLADERRERVQKNRKARIEKEYRLTKHSNALSAKKPVFYRGKSYFVMEKAEGKTLFQVLKEPRTVEQNIHLTIALLKALKEHVHDKGLIHADIKPENIIVDMTTNPITVKIIDLGLSSSKENASKKIEGTLPYLPPEKIKNFKEEFTQGFDDYAMGLILSWLWGSTYLDERFAAHSEYALDNKQRLENIGNVSQDLIAGTLFEGYAVSVEQRNIIGGVVIGLLNEFPEDRWTSAGALDHMNLLVKNGVVLENQISNSSEEMEINEERGDLQFYSVIESEVDENCDTNLCDTTLKGKIEYFERVTKAYQEKLEKNVPKRFSLKNKDIFTNKYAAISELMNILENKKFSNEKKLACFTETFKKNKVLFQTSQDSAAGKRLKKAAVVLSLGIAKFGIWKRDGKKYIKEVDLIANVGKKAST